MNPHVLREAARIAAALDRLFGDVARWDRDTLEPGLLHCRLDIRRVHVGRADDVLALKLVAHRAARVDAHDERTDPERDHDHAGDDAARSREFSDSSFLHPPV